MKHLFIINPACARIKGKPEAVVSEIRAVMKKHPYLSYDIHITRWHRDALGFCRHYLLKERESPVRIHALGGGGTLFEIVNAVIDLPHVQIAVYPMGKTNIFLRYFGPKQLSRFRSVELQLSSDVISVDAFRCNCNFGISNILTGMEAHVGNLGRRIIAKTHLPADFCYILVALRKLFQKNTALSYTLSADGQDLSGSYLSILAANHPRYSQHFRPAADARPDSECLDIYITQKIRPHRRILTLFLYLYGHYNRYRECFSHFTCKKLQISSDDLMWLSVDGETFYGNHFEYEILPKALRLVYPLKIQRQEGQNGTV